MGEDECQIIGDGMASDMVIQVEDVAKSYTMYAHPRQRLFDALTVAESRRARDVFWALRDISFGIRRGESVGIVGRNGSGKSTLLQILAGTLQPSRGKACVSGRVAALLELGSGFNPEFTGRENVYMNASILGLTHEQTDACFDRIVDFAEIGDFIDRPTHTYSSGMLLRLAFAVQVQIEPDILIIDEALAVGDELFQRKCFAALSAFHRAGGTLLFVSHIGSVVKELCDYVIMLDEGEMVLYGDSGGAIDEYHQYLFSVMDRRERRQWLQSQYVVRAPDSAVCRPVSIGEDTPSLGPEEGGGRHERDFLAPAFTSASRMVYPSQAASIRNMRLERVEGEAVNHLLPMRRYRFGYEVEFLETARAVTFSMMVRSATGLELGGRASAGPGAEIDCVAKGAAYALSFEFTVSLLPGVYYLNCGVCGHTESQTGFLARVVDGLVFRVLSDRDEPRAGYVDFGIEASVQPLVAG